MMSAPSQQDEFRRPTDGPVFRLPIVSAWFTFIFLGCFVLMVLISLWSTVVTIALLNQMLDGVPVTADQIIANDERQSTVSGWYSLCYIATITPFLIWIYRASRNLHSLGALNQTVSPTAAVLWWFVPIACFYKPYQAMNEIWKGSTPRSKYDWPLPWRETATPPLLRFWWATWIVAFGIALYRLWAAGSGNIDSIDDLLFNNYLLIGSHCLMLVASTLFYLVVRGVTRNQDRQNRLMSSRVAISWN